MTTVGSTFAWCRRGRFNVVVHPDRPPSDADWDSLLADYAVQAMVRVLVYTEGGAPNAAQLVRLTGTLKRRESLIAVLTHSALARAAGMALSWFRPDIRILGPTAVDAALDYLGATGAERADLVRTLAELKADLGMVERRIA